MVAARRTVLRLGAKAGAVSGSDEGVDLIIAAAVFAVSAWIGVSYVRIPEVARGAMFYQDRMGPAVAWACGRGLTDTDGFVDAGSPGGKALSAFLQRTSDRFDCAALPQLMTHAPLSAFQSASRYLLLALGLVWKVRGVSWNALVPLYGMLFGMVGGAAYLILRYGMNRVLAGAATLLFVTSPLHLSTLPHLRDYAKAPFFFAMTLVLARLVTRSSSPRAVIAWSALIGAVLGVGFGVRFDVETYLVFFVIAICLFLPGPLWRELSIRAMAAAASLVAFVLTAAPILSAFELGRNSWHVVLLGFAERHDKALGLRSSVYQLGSLYDDSLIATVVNAYWGRVHGATSLVALTTVEYARASAAYYRELANVFPADIVIRAWAAVLQTLMLPFGAATTGPPPGVSRSAVLQLYAWRGDLLDVIGWSAPWVCIGVVALLARVNMRWALCVVAFLMFFGGLASLQFQARHIFLLELVPFWLVGSGLQMLLSVRRLPKGPWWPAIAFAAALFAVVTVPVAGLRAYQQPRAKSLLEQYEAEASQPLTRVADSAGNGVVRFVVDPLEDPRSVAMPSQLVIADFGGAGCDFDRVNMTVRYTPSAIDFSRSIDVAIPDRPEERVRVLVPVYGPAAARGQPQFRLAGLELPAHQAPCLQQVSALRDPNRLPLLMDAVLPPDWRNHKLYETVAGWESGSERVRPKTYTVPAGGEFGRSFFARAVEPLSASPQYVSPLASMPAAGQVDVDGWARGAAAYLVTWRPTAKTEDDYLVVEGTASRGGFEVGLVSDERWVAQAMVPGPGPFRVVIRVPDARAVTPILASHVAGRLSRNALRIDRIGWIHDDGRSRNAR
jgi:hypothetical protein